MNDPVASAEGIARYAATACRNCGHSSAHHSDIGTCEACDCLTFDELTT